jgi:6-phospho-beta-glucosidase
MNKLRNDFLWGGAVAAHQLEGGYRGWKRRECR